MNDVQNRGKPRGQKHFAPMTKGEADEIYQACSGQWESIISALSSVDICEALAAKGRHVVCHTGHSTKKNFRLFRDFDETGGAICSCGSWSDGFSLLNHLNGWDRRTAFREVISYLEGSGYRKPANHSKPKQSKAVFELNDESASKLTELWSRGKPIAGTAAESYFRKRSLTAPLPSDDNVRFVESIPYWDDEGRCHGQIPAIISLLRSPKSGHPLSIHRIYITEDGEKADVPQPKKLMTPSIDGAIGQLGGVIMAYPLNGPVLAVTEGLETALAVRSAHPTLAVWATYSASVLTKFEPPEGVKSVAIFGDVDKSGTGQVVAARLALKLERLNITTKICLPRKHMNFPVRDNLFTETESREAVTSRLSKEGYEIVDRAEISDCDWNDIWIEDKHRLNRALMLEH